MKATGASRLLTIFLTGPLLACKPADRKIVDALESSASWTATAQEVAAGWSKHDHPIPYTKDSLEAARDDLEKARKTIRKAAQKARTASDGADALLVEAEDAIREMSAGVEKADSARVAAERAELFDIEKRLRTMADRARSGS